MNPFRYSEPGSCRGPDEPRRGGEGSYKKTQKTPPGQIELAARRLRDWRSRARKLPPTQGSADLVANSLLDISKKA